MEVGFCDAAGRGFYQVQPTSHLERWSLPFDNGTHLEIPWRPDRSACGRNVSSYFVDVQTSTPVLNLFIGVFGSFPQDLCDPRGSKAKNAVSLVDEGGTCSPYTRGCTSWSRMTAFEVPTALRQLTRLDVEITVRGYGSLSPVGRPEERTEVLMWCHKYRKARARRVTYGGQASSSGVGGTARRSWLRWLPFRGGGRGGGERSKPVEAYAATEVRLSWLLALPVSWVLVALPLRYI